MQKSSSTRQKASLRRCLVLLLTVVLVSSGFLAGTPVSAAVAGLNVEGRALLYTADELEFPNTDGSVSTWKKDADNIYFMVSRADYFLLYYGPIDAPMKNFVGVSGMNHSGFIGNVWIQSVYKYPDGTLLGLTHRESYGTDKTVDCFFIGLSKSTDNGRNWRYLGDVLAPHVNFKEPVLNGVGSAQGNISGVPYIVVGEDLYIYYAEQTGTEKRLSVAKAPLATVKSAIDNNMITPFVKYSDGEWTEPGMGGTGSNIIPGGTVSNEGIDYGEGHKLFDLHSDAAWVPSLGKYLITANDEGGSRFMLYSSTDGLNWEEDTVLDSSKNSAYFRSAYSCFMSLSEGTSDDCSVLGDDFYIMYPRDYTAHSSGEQYFAIHCTVGEGSAVIKMNDDQQEIDYDGDWSYSRNRGLGDYNNDGHFSNTVGAVCEYTFDGTAIDYYSEKYSDMGDVDVYIDGEFKANVNLNNGTRLLQQKVYSASGLEDGSHTIKIVNKTSKYGNVDYFVVSKVRTEDVVLNNDDSGITYSGVWETSSNRGMGDYNDDVAYAISNGDYFEYTFTGTGVEYITEKNSDMGSVDVYINGVFQKTVSCVNATRIAQQSVYSVQGLSDETHTLKVVKKDGAHMLLDALKVF